MKDKKNTISNNNFKDIIRNLPNQNLKNLENIEKIKKESEKYFLLNKSSENKLKLLESNIINKIHKEKYINLLDENILEKITIFLKNISKLNPNILLSIEQQLKFTDIEPVNINIKDLEENKRFLEKKNLKYKNKKYLLKIENKNLKNQIFELLQSNENLIKQLKILENNFEKISYQKIDLEINFKELKRHNENILENEKKRDKKISEYNELKLIMEENIRLDKEKNDYEENKKKILYNKFKENIFSISHFDIIKNITQYLTVKDINNFNLTCKIINISFKNNLECMRDYYKKIISLHKNKLKENKQYDFKKEYFINNNEIEKLFKL